MNEIRKTTSFGALIKAIRIERNISQSKLCRGICSTSALSRYEREERFPEKIVADSILERLGISTNRMEFITTDKEFLLDKLIYELNECKIDSINYKRLLKEFEKDIENCNKLYRQLCMLKKIIYTGSNDKKQIEKALLITDCPECFGRNNVYTKTELELMMRYHNNDFKELYSMYEYTKKAEYNLVMSDLRLRLLMRLEELHPNGFNGEIISEIKDSYNISEFIDYYDDKNKDDMYIVASLLKESNDGLLKIGNEKIWENIKNLI